MLSDIHPDLRQRIILYSVMGWVWVAVGAGAILYLAFAGGEDVRAYACLTVFGAVMLFLGWLMVFNAPRWYKRATAVLMQQPETMLLTLREEGSSDSTTLYADLRLPGSSPGSRPTRSVTVLWPRWKVELKKDLPVEVYQDREADGPVVINTPQGLLWSMPYKRVGLPWMVRSRQAKT